MRFLSVVGKPYFTTTAFAESQIESQNTDDEIRRHSRFVQWLLMRQIQVRSLDLSVLAHLKNVHMQFGVFLTQLQTLRVSTCDIWTQRMAFTVIRNCASKLEYLSFASPVGDYELQQLQYVSFPNLRRLDMSGCKASSRAVGDLLMRMPQLQSLSLDRATFFDQHITTAVKNHCKYLRSLSLVDCREVNLEAFAVFAPSQFSSLDISNCSSITESAFMKHIAHLVAVTRKLNVLKSTGLTEEVLRCLISIQLSPQCDKVIDIRDNAMKISPDLRESLSTTRGISLIGL
jgi:hypothetical protein